MKKLLLSALAVFSFTAINAQVEVYAASDSVDFLNWTTVDSDADGFDWTIITYTGDANFEVQGAVVATYSYDNASSSALTPDNFLVSPVISLDGYMNSTLTWKTGSLDAAWANEHYAVYVVSNFAEVATATPVFEETLAAGDIIYDRSVDISSVDGQASVFVVFRHYDVTDMFAMFVDDITVTAEATSGINESVIATSVYPNPANDVLNIVVNEEIANVSITTLDGKVVATSTTSSVNVAELTTGMYIYEVTTSNGNVSRDTFMKK